jgi:hypothetical protein
MKLKKKSNAKKRGKNKEKACYNKALTRGSAGANELLGQVGFEPM